MINNLSLFTEKSPEKTIHSSGGFVKFSAVLDLKSQDIIKKNKLTKPYQFFGIWIAQNLGEFDYLPVYIKLAKFQDRILLETAVSYVKDYPDPKSRHRLFMWYLKGKMKKTVVVKKTKKASQRLF
jgi:hypothetical protein